MRRWVLFISVVSLAAGIIGPVTLPETTGKDLRATSGEIAAIDVKALTMTIQDEVAGSGVEKTDFLLDPNVTVRMHGLRGKLKELKVGDYVTVRYAKRDGKLVAMEIQHS